MTKDTKGNLQLAELARVLEAFGGDPARWPPTRRGALLTLAETNPAARTLIAEARALDTVLDRAAVPVAAPDALAASILRQAAAEPRATSNVVTLPPAQRRPVPQAAPVARRPQSWAAPALMAASLAAGIFIGSGANLVPALQDVAEALGWSGDLGLTSIVFNDTHSGFDEDVL